MPTKEEALVELYRRGTLSDTQKQAVEELARRGKITLPTDQTAAQPADQQAAPVSLFDPAASMAAGSASPSVAAPRVPTRAEQELPELAQSGLLAGEEQGANMAKTVAALATLSDPQEIAQVLSTNFPAVGIQYDEQGNMIATNNRTGARAILNRPGVSGQDVIQFLGLGAAFSPAGRVAGAIPATLAAVGTEAAIQGVQAAAGGEFDEEDVALAGAIPVAGKMLEGAAGIPRRLMAGRVPDDAQQVISAGDQFGAPVMTSDVIPPTTLTGKLARSTGEKIPFAGTGTARAGQQEMREEAIERFRQSYAVPSYEAVVQSMKEKKSSIMGKAGDVMERTKSQLDNAGGIPVDQSMQRIDDALAELSRPNVATDSTAIQQLEDMRNLLAMPQTFSTLKENRTFLNDIIEAAGRGDRSQLPTRAKSLLKSAAYGMKQDMERFAKDNLSPQEFMKWKRANAVWGEQAEKLRKTKIKNILDKGDVTPEKVDSMLFSKSPSEVKALFNSLTAEGRNNARSALIYRAYDNASRRAGGISPNAFATELTKLTKNTDVFFRGKEKRQLEGFKRLLDATRRAQDAAVETPTGQQLLGAGAGYAAFTDLGATLGLGGTAGGLARLYESAPVRNALLKLGSIDRRSDRYLNALFEAQAALASAAQALKSAEEAKETDRQE